jgi:hypothetical protein
MAAAAGLANYQSAIGFEPLAAVEEDAARSAVVAEGGSEQITSRAAYIDDGLELRKVTGSSDSSRLRGRESRSWFC